MGTAGVGVPLRELGVVLLTALVFTYLTTGIVRSLVIRSGHLSEIRERDVHTVRKPQLGGLAMFTGLLIAVYLAQQLPALTRGFRPITPEMDAILVASAIIVFVGVIAVVVTTGRRHQYPSGSDSGDSDGMIPSATP